MELIETSPEIVSIEIRQSDGTYKWESYFSNYKANLYVPINPDKLLLPIEMDMLGIYGKMGCIRNHETILEAITEIRY
jgi:hypothetical protein